MAGETTFQWLGTPQPAASQAPPIMYVGGLTPNQNGSGSPQPVYDPLIQAAVSTLQSAGLNVRYVNVPAYVNQTTDYTGGTVGNITVAGVDRSSWASE